MANRYVRSIFWFCSFTALGYGLLALTSAEDKTEKLKKKLPGVERNTKEVISKNQQFVNVLQSASDNNSKPYYRLSKSEFDKELE